MCRPGGTDYLLSEQARPRLAADHAEVKSRTSSAAVTCRAQLCHQFPVSIVTDGHGLNITLASYLDRFDFGSSSTANSCRTCGIWRTCTSPRSVCCPTPAALNGPQPLQPAAPRHGSIKLAQTAAKPTATTWTSTTGSGAQR